MVQPILYKQYSKNALIVVALSKNEFNFVGMIKKLLHAIEQQTGLNMQHNHDFISLSQQIFERLHESISDSTLKRLWGYVDPQNVKPRTNTLNILAVYLGCEDFDSFCKMGGGKISEEVQGYRECDFFCPHLYFLQFSYG